MINATVVPPEVAQITVNSIFVWFTFASFVFSTMFLMKRRVSPFIKQLRNFLSDWAGEPERPGVKRKPGVMERLSAVEYQFTPNGGNSFHDKLNLLSGKMEKVDRIEKQVSLLLTYLGTKDETLRELVRKQDEIGIQ